MRTQQEVEQLLVTLQAALKVACDCVDALLLDCRTTDEELVGPGEPAESRPIEPEKAEASRESEPATAKTPGESESPETADEAPPEPPKADERRRIAYPPGTLPMPLQPYQDRVNELIADIEDMPADVELISGLHDRERKYLMDAYQELRATGAWEVVAQAACRHLGVSRQRLGGIVAHSVGKLAAKHDAARASKE